MVVAASLTVGLFSATIASCRNVQRGLFTAFNFGWRVERWK
jgi:hypothetical protein